MMWNIVGVKIISCKVSPRVFLLFCCVLTPKWDFCVHTCQLVEIAWWAARGSAGARLLKALLVTASCAASQQPACAHAHLLASTGVC